MIDLVIATLIAAIGAALAQRPNTNYSSTGKIIVGLLFGISAAIALGMIIGAATGNETFTAGVPGYENASRLCASKSVLHGYRIYYPPGEGPMLSTIYPPGMYLFYLPVALLPFPTTWLVIAGSFLSFLWCLAPGAVILKRALPTGRTDPLFWLALSATILFFLNFRSLCYSTTSIHADAPALGCIAWAAFLLFSSGSETSNRSILLGALLTACGIWCKQVMIAAPCVFAVLVWLSCGWRRSLQFSVSFAIFAIVLGIGFFALFGKSTLLLHILEMPRLHPWWQVGGSPGVLNFVDRGGQSVVDKLKTLWSVSDLFMADRWSILVVIGAGLGEFIRRRMVPLANRNRGQFPLWVVYCSLALALIPMALMAKAKVGGAKNAFSLFDYFAVLAAIHALVDFSRREDVALQEVGAGNLEDRRKTRMTLCFALCVVLIIGLKGQILWLPRYVRGLNNNPLIEAEAFIRQHPGEAYFIADPMANLQVQGTLFHYDVALNDYYLAFGPSRFSMFRAHTPSNFRLLVVPRIGLQTTERVLFPEYDTEVFEPSLSQWRVFARRE